MTLAEQISKKENNEAKLRKDLETMPFTQKEKDYWSKYILNNMQHGVCNLKTDLYSNTILYKDYTINNSRVKAFIEWIKNEGLYYYGQFNCCMTLDAVKEWEESVKKNSHCTGRVVYGNGIVNYEF